jgi:acyl carrier protein
MTDEQANLADFLNSLTPGRDFRAQADALQLDSLALLQVVVYLEQNHGIRLADHDVEPEDLRSVAGILALIEHRL